MKFKERIIEIVLNYVKSVRFEGVDTATALRHFYTETQSLFECDKAHFDACSFSLLMPDDFSVFSELDIVQMECAGIYRKSGFDVYLFRMRYFLEIATEKDDALLEQKAISAFLYRGENVFASIDERAPYEHLFVDILKNKDIECGRLSDVLRQFVLEKWSKDFENFVPLVQISRLLGKRISKKEQMLFLILTETSVILGDGLQTWVKNNRDYRKKVSKLADAFGMLGMTEAQTIFTTWEECFSTISESDFVTVEENVREHIRETDVYAVAQRYYEKQMRQ